MFAGPDSKGGKRLDQEPVHILLLEDDSVFAELIGAQLRRGPWMDFRLEVAGTLAEAKSKLANREFGLVLADLNLPDSSGLATIEALARAGEQLIIVLTGERDPALRSRAIESGAYDFLSKDDLSAAALARVLRLAALQSRTFRSLRDSEKRFRGLVMQSSDWYWEQDEQFRFTVFDGRVTEISGNHPSQAIGKRRWEISTITPVSCTWEEHRTVLEARQPFRDFVYSRLGDDGKLRYLTVSGEPVYRADGSFAGYRGLATDITAQRLAEEELRRFRLAMEHSADMILLIDRASMRHVDVNGAACRLLGYSREELLAMGPENTLPVSRQDLEKAYDALIADPSQASGMNSHYICKDGAHLPFESTRRAIRSGDTWLIAAISRDIRERLASEAALRQSEERFRSLSALSSDWFWETDAEHRFIHTPPRATEFSGLKAPSYVGKRRWEVPGLAPVDGDWRSHREVLERRESFRDLELVQLRADGSRAYLRVSGQPVYGPDGSFRGYHGTAKDITARKREEEELRRFRAAMDMSLDAIYLVDRATMRFVDVNEAACRGVGYTREQLLAMGPHDLLTVPRAELERNYDEVITAGAAGATSENSYAGANGRPRWTELHRRALRSGEGWIIVSISRDITDRKLAEQRQAAHLRHQERIARFGQSALARRDPAELVGEAVQNLLEGLDAEAVAYVESGPSAGEVVLRAVVGVAGAAAVSAVLRCEAGAAILLALRSGERMLVDDAGLPCDWARGRGALLAPVRKGGALAVFSRESQAFGAEEINFIEAAASVLSAGLQRIDSEGRLAYLAQFDPLTGLPNRALLADRFQQMIVQARRRASPLGVLFIDLDEFKMVNDTLGHAGGDELLKEVAVRLQAAVRPGDTVARISGDEFAVVLVDLARPEDAALVAQKIIGALGAPTDIQGQEVFATASVGIALYPGDGADAEALIGAADAAMYRAKQSGRNAFQFFTTEINQRSRARAQLGADLRRALERGEFTLAYQPKFDLMSRRPSGAEALLRWKHPERDMVSPAEFIPVLEETGMIVPVGEWVLRRVCEDLKAWRAQGVEAGPVAVNLSARQFRQQELDLRIKAIVEAAGVAPGSIELEITESQLMQDPEHAIRVMRALCDTGMRIAIDDFGTGYSSLSYLTRFPVSTLKIDRSFVHDVQENPGHAAIVRTIIEMAQTMGFQVIAEGIETEAEAEYLRQHGCEMGQGYLFARPMPAAELSRLMAAGESAEVPVASALPKPVGSRRSSAKRTR